MNKVLKITMEFLKYALDEKDSGTGFAIKYAQQNTEKYRDSAARATYIVKESGKSKVQEDMLAYMISATAVISGAQGCTKKLKEKELKNMRYSEYKFYMELAMRKIELLFHQQVNPLSIQLYDREDGQTIAAVDAHFYLPDGDAIALTTVYLDVTTLLHLPL